METVQTPYGNICIYINRLPSEEANLFHLSFVDSSNKVYVFYMKESNGGWAIVNEEDIPGWVVELQAQFEVLIRREQMREHISEIASSAMLQ